MKNKVYKRIVLTLIILISILGQILLVNNLTFNKFKNLKEIVLKREDLIPYGYEVVSDNYLNIIGDANLSYNNLNSYVNNLTINFNAPLEKDMAIQIYYTNDKHDYNEVTSKIVTAYLNTQQINIALKRYVQDIRFDISNEVGEKFTLNNISINNKLDSTIYIRTKIIERNIIILTLESILLILIYLIKNYQQINKYFKKNYKEILFIIFCMYNFYLWSKIIPFNRAPDEYMRYDIPLYIFNYGKLPHGGDESIRNPIWGFSYGFTPYLPSILSAGLMYIFNYFSNNQNNLYHAARVLSVLASTGTVYYCLKIGKELFSEKIKWLFTVLVSFLPQFTFISSYINNDATIVFSTSMIIYYWIKGLKEQWNIKSCIGLALGISICALTYYNAYGFILCSIILFLISNIYNKDIKKSIKPLLIKGSIISIIVISLISWYFIRNYIIYDGDLLAMDTMYMYGEKYAQDIYKPSYRQTPQNMNISLVYMIINQGWFINTLKSFIGNFDYMCLPLKTWMYIIYYILIFVSITGYITKRISKNFNVNFKDKKFLSAYQLNLLNYNMLISSLITVLLSIKYSYEIDYQPQGRYIMPILIPLMYFISKGLEYIENFIRKNLKLKIDFLILVVIIYIGLALYTLTDIIIPFY